METPMLRVEELMTVGVQALDESQSLKNAEATMKKAEAQAEVKEPRDGAARRADTKGSHGVKKRGKKR